MNGDQDNNARNDEARKMEKFDRYLAGESPVSRGYAELGSEEPGPELDVKILSEAERVAKTRFFPSTIPGKRWMAPVALAATVVLSFSVVMSIVFDTPTVLESEVFTAESHRKDAGSGDIREYTLREMDEANLPESKESLTTAFGEIAGEADRSRTLGMAADADRNEKLEQQEAPAARAPAARMALKAESPMELPETPVAERDIVIDVLREHLKSIGRAAPSDSPDLRYNQIEEIVVTSRSADEKISPDVRLEEILDLYVINESEAADLELAHFRERFPDHPVSMELTERGY
jgi:hypothetical protein